MRSRPGGTMSDPTDPERALVRRLSAVRSWSLWSLPGPILAYVVLVELIAAVVRWVVNVVLVSVAIKATVPDVRWSNLIISPDSRGGDVVEVCLGTLSTVLVAVNPLLIVVTVPPVLMLQRAVQYAQLVA